ncbi:Protein of unknown function [Pyronema omphalodes CBS 100304]|uniref:Uncharacterized protein n=1 Tax=Pyronema omphalodes (strain CBS 100304) TaxID=1076935 RepID=U4LBZ5_PYROM|nr:Protein of unknown function [Pyronema omphalodes CBS 100304]
MHSAVEIKSVHNSLRVLFDISAAFTAVSA